MTGSRSPADPARDTEGGGAGPGETDPGASAPCRAAVISSGDLRGLDSRLSSSWTSTADIEIQRDLVTRRVFNGAPPMIERFEVEKLVGVGASAAVYAARDPLLERRVAIKVLARAREGGVGAATERVIREARALAHLSHRNVVAIYEVGQWNDRPFIVMELIEGTTLAQWLVARRRSVAETLAVFQEAGTGLAAAHARGHVHRDFKPANVLVAHDDRVVVSDFGLVDDAAKGRELAGEAGAGAALGAIEAAGGRAPDRRPVGTPAYVAPEQRAGAAAHPSADVYSFALALVEAVLGYHPMPESSTTWKAALRTRVPRRLHQALCAALTPEPAQRAQSLGPLLEAISVPRKGRPRRVAGALALGSAVLIALAALSWSRGDRVSNRRVTPVTIPDPSLLPSEIWKGLEALLATPLEARDAIWRERARTWLMLPIPTRVPCSWPESLRTLAIVGDQVVALDPRGRVMSCAIRTGIVSTVASDVICIRPVDDTMIGVAFGDRRIAVYQRRGEGWNRVPATGPSVMLNPDSPRFAYCRFTVSSQGIVPPKIFEYGRPAPPQADIGLIAGGGRRIFQKADLSLWVQVGDTTPKLLIPPNRGVRFDGDLRYAVVNTHARVQIFDLTTASVVADAPLPSTRIDSGSVDISRDGSVAAALGLDGPLLWWRRGERQWQSQTIERDGAAVAKLSPRGRRVLIRSSLGRLDIRELSSGRRYPLTNAQIQAAQFLDDDQVVAIDESGAVWLWSLAHQRSWVLADHAGAAWMWGFATCHRGSSVLTATNRKDRPILISSPSGAPQVVLAKPPGAQIYGLACQGDRILAGTRDGHLLEWEWPTGRMLADHDLGVRAWVWTVATAAPAGGPGAVLIGTGQTRDSRNQLNSLGGGVLAVRNGALVPVFTARIGGNTGIGDIAISSDGRRAAAAASSGELVLIDVAGATASSSVHAHGGEVHRVRVAEGDRIVVSAGDDGYLRTWGLVDGALQSEVQLGHGKIFDLDLRGTVALVATADGHVGVWNLTTQRLLRAYGGHSAWVTNARFDASSRWIASGDVAGRACVHRVDLEACHAALVGHTPGEAIRHVRFLGDGQIVTASEDGTVRQWNPPYDASSAELACELQRHLFDRERGHSNAATRDCAASVAVRRPPHPEK